VTFELVEQSTDNCTGKPPPRAGEQKNPPARSGRFFKMENSWYCVTREGAIRGPYNSQIQAKSAMQALINLMIAQKWSRLHHL